MKLGHAMAVKMLDCGVNDLGGTLMNESISRSSGAKYGQEVTPREMADLIRAVGQTQVQRNSLYAPLALFETDGPPGMEPLGTYWFRALSLGLGLCRLPGR